MNRQARLSCRPRIKTYANDKKMKNRNKILFTSLAVLAVGLFAIDMMVGSVGIAPSDVWAALTGGECDPITRKIIIDIRLTKALVSSDICIILFSLNASYFLAAKGTASAAYRW